MAKQYHCSHIVFRKQLTTILAIASLTVPHLSLIAGLVDCSVEGCVSCSNTSIDVCEECEDGLMISQDGSNCSLLTTEAPSTFEGSTTIDDRTTTEVAEPFITTSRLIGN